MIREVEARMNRDYLPPSLKLQPNSVNCGPQSPPAAAAAAAAITQPAVVCQMTTVAHQSAPPPPIPSSNTVVMRRFGRACKLPTVQEVGELFFYDFII